MRAPTLLRRSLLAAVIGGGLVGCGLEQSDLQMKVVEATSGAPIAGAIVEVNGVPRGQTNYIGLARLKLTPGAYDYEVKHRGYSPRAGTVTLFSGMGAQAVVELERRAPQSPSPSPSPSGSPGPSPSPGASPTPKPSPSVAEQNATLFGKVTDPTGVRLPKAYVIAASEWGIPYGYGTSNGQGEYKFALTNLPKGKSVKVVAMADGYESRSRYVTPVGEYRIDFAGASALKSTAPDPELPAMVRLSGRVKDTQGRDLDGAWVKVESENVRFPFNVETVADKGRFEVVVPTALSLRFTASMRRYRNVTFTETVTSSGTWVDFTGYRALEPSSGQETE